MNWKKRCVRVCMMENVVILSTFESAVPVSEIYLKFYVFCFIRNEFYKTLNSKYWTLNWNHINIEHGAE